MTRPTEPYDTEQEVVVTPRWPVLAAALLLLLALLFCFGGVIAVFLRGEFSASVFASTYLLCIMPALLLLGAAAGLWWLWGRSREPAPALTRWQKAGQFVAILGVVAGIAMWLGGGAILLGGPEMTQGVLVGGSLVCFLPGLLLVAGGALVYFFSRGRAGRKPEQLSE